MTKIAQEEWPMAWSYLSRNLADVGWAYYWARWDKAFQVTTVASTITRYQEGKSFPTDFTTKVDELSGIMTMDCVPCWDMSNVTAAIDSVPAPQPAEPSSATDE